MVIVKKRANFQKDNSLKGKILQLEKGKEFIEESTLYASIKEIMELRHDSVHLKDSGIEVDKKLFKDFLDIDFRLNLESVVKSVEFFMNKDNSK